MFVTFRFTNVQSVVEQIYPVISGIIKEEEFEILFEYATKERQNVLIIDQTSKERDRMQLDSFISKAQCALAQAHRTVGASSWVTFRAQAELGAHSPSLR